MEQAQQTPNLQGCSNAVGMMMQNLEKKHQHLQREAEMVEKQLEVGKLVQIQFAREQTLLEIAREQTLLETKKKPIEEELAQIKLQVRELTQSIVAARAAVAASAAVAAGAAVVAETGIKTEATADTGASVTAAAAVHTPSSTDPADNGADTEMESQDEDNVARDGAVTTRTLTERSERGKPRACAICRKTGHKQNTCPEAYCMRCCQTGHLADYCKNKPCIHCGKMLLKKDHYPVKCPLKPTSGRGRGGRGGRTAGRGGRGGAAGAAATKSN